MSVDNTKRLITDRTVTIEFTVAALEKILGKEAANGLCKAANKAREMGKETIQENAALKSFGEVADWLTGKIDSRETHLIFAGPCHDLTNVQGSGFRFTFEACIQQNGRMQRLPSSNTEIADVIEKNITADTQGTNLLIDRHFIEDNHLIIGVD